MKKYAACLLNVELKARSRRYGIIYLILIIFAFVFKLIMKIIFIICSAIYLARVLTIRIFSEKCRNKCQTDTAITELPLVSIIVAARNEEKNIANCINSILKSNYPKDKFEIVIVNDRSTDATLRIITQLAHDNENIIIQNAIERTNKNLRGKPGAINIGINAAKGNIFLITDADCTVPENWILTMASHFKEPTVGMVCSYTNVKGNKPFYYFQAAEWFYMHTYGCAGIAMDTPLGCFGNNMAITREAYYNVGGYENIPFSITEDLAILTSVHNAGYKIHYVCDKDSLVETLPNKTLKEYIVQHKRWAIGGLALGYKAFAFVISSACIWITLVIGLLLHDSALLLTTLILRILGDAVILFPIFKILRTNHLRMWLPISIFFFSAIEIVLPFTLLNRKVTWKDQVFNGK